MTERELRRARGVCWSGLGPDPAPHRSPDVLLRRASALREALDAWQASPAGRLHAALAQVRAAARDAHRAAEALEAALARGEQTSDERLLALAASAAALTDAAACATNTASSRPSTTSPRNSAS